MYYFLVMIAVVIFGGCFSLSDAYRKERGSGIGLAVCDEIVTRHKGLLDIENAPEGGLIVTIRLPAGEENPNI